VKAIDHAFQEAMRERIDVLGTVDKLQAHIQDPEKTPLLNTQLKAAEILLRKAIPDLKAVEHTQAPTAPHTREELLERLAKLRAGTPADPERPGPAGSSATH
jgi:hypothetical protein